MRTPGTVTLHARNAVALVFAVNGFAFATWVSRIPEARDALGLTPGQLGTLLIAGSVGAVLALPTTGMWVHRFGAARVVAAAAVIDALGLALAGAGAGAATVVWLTAVGLFLLGFGSGAWDVAMNVEGAAVEHELARTIMPRFHAAFSLGTVVGAGVGALAAWGGLSVAVHLVLSSVLVAVSAVVAVRWFLSRGVEEVAEEDAGGRRHPFRAWAEPRTLAIGLMVLAMALTEGVANDWLAVALVDGYDVAPWVGASGFALFVAAMTLGRVTGTGVLDRFGRVPVLWSCMALAAVGVLLVVLGDQPLVVAAGIVLWGVGASLGFPVGMSAAADDPEHAAARVSVVSTIGYTAFLAGPPVLGYLGDHVGVLHALLLVAVLLVPSALAVPAARERVRSRDVAGTPGRSAG
ncbi:MAG TPA: MFS transporter [Nocardioidaceae bacterium]|nr:MFS transporter [Nocardioidaceae bacterium]